MAEILPQDYVYHFPENFDEINLRAKDGAVLNALHFKVNNPKGVILYFHGNAGDLSRWGLVIQKFSKLGYDVLVMDYRGYGKSTGRRKETFFYQDSQLLYDFLVKHYDEDKITVYGRSLGTTFATYVASQNHPNKLILEAPFYSLQEVAQQRFPIYPISWFIHYEFPSYKYLKKVSCPVTIFHGTDDNTVNIENSEMLSKLLPEKQLKFIPIPSGSHNNLDQFELYTQNLKEELDGEALK